MILVDFFFHFRYFFVRIPSSFWIHDVLLQDTHPSTIKVQKLDPASCPNPRTARILRVGQLSEFFKKIRLWDYVRNVISEEDAAAREFLPKKIPFRPPSGIQLPKTSLTPFWQSNAKNEE